MTPTRVVLADDHTLLRAGLRSLLEHLEDVEVVGEAADGLVALSLVEKHRPNLLLTDIAMPKLDGLELAARVIAEHPETRVIVLSMHLCEEYVREAIRIGASGYLVKASEVSELALAIRAVARGETYLSPAVATQLLADYQRFSSLREADESPLTPRQREVLVQIAEGKTTKSIARILGVSVKTVESHRTQLMERLRIHDIAGLVRYAMNCGLLKPQE